PLFARRRRDAGELIAAARRRRFRQQSLEVGEDVAAAGDGRGVHAHPRWLPRIIAQVRAANPPRSLSPNSVRSLPRWRGGGGEGVSAPAWVLSRAPSLSLPRKRGRGRRSRSRGVRRETGRVG